jgi:hypothetical protein
MQALCNVRGCSYLLGRSSPEWGSVQGVLPFRVHYRVLCLLMYHLFHHPRTPFRLLADEVKDDRPGSASQSGRFRRLRVGAYHRSRGRIRPCATTITL